MRYAIVISMVGAAALGFAGGLLAHQPPVSAESTTPTAGFTLHIDADQHFGDVAPGKIAHHWCKAVSADLTECQLYDGDGPNARLVGVETIVPAAVWKSLPASEQALWHYHATEIQKVHATLPDTPADQQAKIIESLKPTYGKVWILWNPEQSANPVGQPSIVVLK